MKNFKVSLRDLRVFGFIWGLILAFFAHKSEKFSVPLYFLSLAFFLTAAFIPQIYVKSGLYAKWIKFGNIMGKINGFLISFILFYGIFTPVSFLLKFLKKDLLNKKLNKAAHSYFIDRKIQPGDMKNQF